MVRHDFLLVIAPRGDGGALSAFKVCRADTKMGHCLARSERLGAIITMWSVVCVPTWQRTGSTSY